MSLKLKQILLIFYKKTYTTICCMHYTFFALYNSVKFLFKIFLNNKQKITEILGMIY